MKRIILFFAVCLGLSVSQTTFADNEEIARAATKRTQTTTTTTNSNRSFGTETKRATTQQQKNTRTAIKQPQQKVVSRTTTSSPQVKTRTPVAQPTKQNQSTQNVTKRVSATARNTINSKIVDSRKAAKNAKATRSAIAKKIVRATELDSEKINSIKSADYSKCKTVYYECMDEFCANKDTNLRRCACSSRIHEFDNIKKQLNSAEDKMLDFNQRLLTVSMDKEDAAAINIATEGETAFQLKDTSESEKLLQKITKSLNNSGDSRINNNLSAISLSLDMDTAWDNIDSLSGVATTSKNGLDLYNAARPICVDMAKEVCSDDELTIVQDGYKLTIQQDCNTVAKSYDTLYNNAMNKIHESGALLDISRLSIYQQRNSDDILTCKKKILTQLSDASVCGENLYKCLDVTGEYIDPSTGKAFLSENLHNMVNLLQEPTGEEKWSRISQNEPFVNFLNSKKEFLKPSIEQCQDISDTVWKEFLDDALSQIKLAQNSKLEEIKRSCTTLVAECKTDALNDLSDFDSRALSIFSVAADKTANTMCSNIHDSCIALMDIDAANTWSGGITGIATDITYDTIMETCAQIGRDCIIQKCNGTSGNFALCTNITSDNRMAILKRDACWREVLNCVSSADNLENMGNLPIVANRSNYYTNIYSNINYSDIPTPCENSDNPTACLIAEQIWGNCETENNSTAITTSGISGTIASNKILIPNSGSTLLSWFALNTGTTNNDASCSTYGCPVDYALDNNGTCQWQMNTTTSTCQIATNRNQLINVLSNLTNYCSSGVRDVFGNCCYEGYKSNGICVPDAQHNALRLITMNCNGNCDGLSTTTTPTLAECTADLNYYCPNNDARKISVYCITTDSTITYNSNTEEYLCSNGTWVLVDQYGNYFPAQDPDSSWYTASPRMSYTQECSDCNGCNNPSQCKYIYQNSVWLFSPAQCDEFSSTQVPSNEEFTIKY